ncbi:hypothetical protein G6F32_015268 [Rhizopus arrhizus]|nr:hypothetical protein G6F32_015268 [Rhizopus arrhizus]
MALRGTSSTRAASNWPWGTFWMALRIKSARRDLDTLADAKRREQAGDDLRAAVIEQESHQQRMHAGEDGGIRDPDDPGQPCRP